MDTLLVSPNTFDAIRRSMLPMAPRPPVEFSKLCGCDIRVSDLVPDRNIQEVWSPPTGGRFVDYGPEDECWMRPLALGTIRLVDCGPYIAMMNEKLMERAYATVLSRESPMAAAARSLRSLELINASTATAFASAPFPYTKTLGDL